MKKHVVIGIDELLWNMLLSCNKAEGKPVNFKFHTSKTVTIGYAISALGNDAFMNLNAK